MIHSKMVGGTSLRNRYNGVQMRSWSPVHSNTLECSEYFLIIFCRRRNCWGSSHLPLKLGVRPHLITDFGHKDSPHCRAACYHYKLNSQRVVKRTNFPGLASLPEAMFPRSYISLPIIESLWSSQRDFQADFMLCFVLHTYKSEGPTRSIAFLVYPKRVWFIRKESTVRVHCIMYCTTGSVVRLGETT